MNVAEENVSLTKAIANYHAKTLDENNALYFTEESFDDFYYGKGSTYPDVNGGVGILFEQAQYLHFRRISCFFSNTLKLLSTGSL